MAGKAKGTSGAKAGTASGGRQAARTSRARNQRAVTVASEEKRIAGEPEVGAAGTVEAEQAVQRVTNYKRHTKAKLSKAFPKIVDNMLNRAADGTLSDAKTKMLLELGGVKDEPKKRVRRKSEPSLGELLLAEVARRHDAEEKQACAGATAVESESGSELGIVRKTGSESPEEVQVCGAETQE